MRLVDPKLDMKLSQMATLERSKIKKIVVHTEGQVIRYKSNNGTIIKVNSPSGLDPTRIVYSGDVDAEELNSWAIHGLKWLGVAYHRVVINGRHSKYSDGTVQMGRPLDKQGSHVQGLNDSSLGICAIGNGDFEDFTQAQKVAIAEQCAIWVRDYGLKVSDVIGHRETPPYVEGTRIDTHKTCPGLKVDMDEIRLMVDGFLDSPPSSVDEKALAVAIAEMRWNLRGRISVEALTGAANLILGLVEPLDEDELELAGSVRNVLEELVAFYR